MVAEKRVKTDMSINTRIPDPITASTSPDEASVHEFLVRVDSRLGQGVSLIQVDCTQLDRVTSSHINALWLAREKCDQQRATLELINVGKGLRRVLEALDLASLFLPAPPVALRLDLQLSPTVESIDSAMSKVVGFLAKSRVPEVTAFELQTVFYEVTTNIRCHGQLTSKDSIRFDAQINEQVVTFTFIDNGVSFDPTSHDSNVDFREPSREQRRNRFGLAMIERLSDSQKYSRTADEQNQLSIRKSW